MGRAPPSITGEAGTSAEKGCGPSLVRGAALDERPWWSCGEHFSDGGGTSELESRSDVEAGHNASGCDGVGPTASTSARSDIKYVGLLGGTKRINEENQLTPVCQQRSSLRPASLLHNGEDGEVSAIF